MINLEKNVTKEVNKLNLYYTPHPIKDKKIEIESEMRRTYKTKPPLISSKFPAVFEITRMSHDHRRLPSIAEKTGKEENKKVEFKRENGEKKKNLISTKGGKIILKPIEIKDPRKIYNSEKSPENKFLFEIEENFAKTSNAKFRVETESKQVRDNKIYDKNNMSVILVPNKIKFEDFIFFRNEQQIGEASQNILCNDSTTSTALHVPIKDKQEEIDLNSTLENWKTKLKLDKYFVKVHYDFKKKGYLFLSFCQYGTLKDVLNYSGLLPDNLLQQISYRILKSLENYNFKTGNYFNCLNLDNIMFDSKCNIKLCPSLKQNFNKHKIETFLKKNWMKIIPNQYEELIKKKIQLFRYGLTILTTALGGLDLFNFSDYLCTHYEDEADQISKCCCLYHCVEKYETTYTKSTQNIKMTSLINGSTYSQEFIDFLCLVLSYKLDDYNFNSNSVKNHSWLKNSSEAKVLVNLFELMTISTEKLNLDLCLDKVNDFTSKSEQLETSMTDLANILNIDVKRLKSELLQFNNT